MAIDQVHDTQQVFRQLMQGMSHPGKIVSIGEQTTELDYDMPCFDATILCALALLDGEVTFHIVGHQSEVFLDKLSQYTLSRCVSIYDADYIFVLQNTSDDVIVTAMENCKNGNLLNPDNSATWIVESSPLSNEARYTLTGPGIKDIQNVHIGVSESIWNCRQKRVEEFPLGIDCIFVDKDAQLVCVPRTTIVQRMEEF